MIGIVDYGVGNLFSLKSSLEYIGAKVVVSGDAHILQKSDKIILPGVGAFEDAYNKLKDSKLDVLLKSEASKGKPLLGICLGMQLLFEKSYEYGVHEGLGLIPGIVAPLSEIISQDLKIPHIGWNSLHFSNLSNKSLLFKYVNENECVYFVHSYYATNCTPFVSSTTDYSCEITASVEKNNVFGCQFHPEKSGRVGLNILKAFYEL